MHYVNYTLLSTDTEMLFAIYVCAAGCGDVRISLTNALQRFLTNATQLPKEFILELDLENVELVETKPFNPLQVKTAHRLAALLSCPGTCFLTCYTHSYAPGDL